MELVGAILVYFKNLTATHRWSYLLRVKSLNTIKLIRLNTLIYNAHRHSSLILLFVSALKNLTRYSSWMKPWFFFLRTTAGLQIFSFLYEWCPLSKRCGVNFQTKQKKWTGIHCTHLGHIVYLYQHSNISIHRRPSLHIPVASLQSESLWDTCSLNMKESWLGGGGRLISHKPCKWSKIYPSGLHL